MTRDAIGLMSPCGWGNLGDAAIQDAMIRGIRARRPDATLIGLTLNPRDTVERHGIAAFPIGARDMPGHHIADTDLAVPLTPTRACASDRPEPQPLRTALKRVSGLRAMVQGARGVFSAPWSEVRHAARALRIARRLETLVVSGGGQLDETWGGPWGVPWDLFKWSLIARVAGARFVVVSVGTESLRSRLSRRFVRAALAGAAYRSFRDEDSLRRARELRIPGEHLVAPDLAFGVHAEGRTSPARDASASVVAVSPMAFAHPEGWPDPDAEVYRDYVATLAAFVRWLIATGHSVVLLATDGGDQRSVADLVQALGEDATRVGVPEVSGVDQLFTALAGVDLVVASRLHAALLAVVAGKPVLALAYHRKVRVQMTEVALGDYCVDLREADLAVLQDRFRALAANAERLIPELRRRVDRYRTSLEAQFDRLFGPEVPRCA